MPTFQWLPRFRADFVRLSPAQQAAFLVAVAQLVEDLRAGGQFRQGQRVKGVQGAPGVFEMTWAPDGRATFGYGDEVKPGEPHVIWRRVGTHDIFRQP
ncbi:MAG: hypothetical protein M3083_10380 [Actinomycetota bacterium]|nr:hypothetical protein [Actinomycetota bacterium]MDQ6910386.1 hypothetical protein [Actinomycetota bacterium]MDQ6946476.1 hypothetical protein [Actinomycetota bacterium]